MLTYHSDLANQFFKCNTNEPVVFTRPNHETKLQERGFLSLIYKGCVNNITS